MASNGRLDTSSLVQVDGWAYLVKNAAAGWNGACDEMVALGYPRPTITAPDGAYRTYAQQVYWKKYWADRGKPQNAATPGYSNHGWGTDADIWNVAAFPRAALIAVFSRWGFTFNVPWENWHIHHDDTVPAGGGSTTISDDGDKGEDMAKTTGFSYTRADGVGICGLITPASGFFTEWQDAGGAYNSAIAAAFDTGNFVAISESHRHNLASAAELVRPPK